MAQFAVAPLSERRRLLRIQQLNGQPVEVVTTITVAFRLDEQRRLDAAHMLNLEWVQHRSGVYHMFPSSTDIKDCAGEFRQRTIRVEGCGRK